MRSEQTTLDKSIKSKKLLPVTRREFETMREMLEELSDKIDALRGEERGRPSPDALPSAFMRRIINGESPLLVWREFRGFTQSALAKKAGLKSHSYIVAIEKKQKPGSTTTLKKLSLALGCDLDDLIG